MDIDDDMFLGVVAEAAEAEERRQHKRERKERKRARKEAKRARKEAAAMAQLPQHNGNDDDGGEAIAAAEEAEDEAVMAQDIGEVGDATAAVDAQQIAEDPKERRRQKRERKERKRARKEAKRVRKEAEALAGQGNAEAEKLLRKRLKKKSKKRKKAKEIDEEAGETAPVETAEDAGASRTQIWPNTRRQCTDRAPEILDTYQNYPIGPVQDIWALGCVLFYLCYRHIRLRTVPNCAF